MWDMARAFNAQGIKVSIISWCGPNDGPLSADGKRRIAECGFQWEQIIGFSNAPEVTLAITSDGKAEYQIGLAKARYAKQIGATILFDDNPYICRAVKDVHLQSFQVYR